MASRITTTHQLPRLRIANCFDKNIQVVTLLALAAFTIGNSPGTSNGTDVTPKRKNSHNVRFQDHRARLHRIGNYFALGPLPTSAQLLSNGTIPVDAAASKESMLDHAVTQQQEEDC